MPSPVDKYFEKVKESNPEYSDAQAWATAWSIYCKYKNPGSEHCKRSPDEYFESKSAYKISSMITRVIERFKYAAEKAKKAKVEFYTKPISEESARKGTPGSRGMYDFYVRIDGKEAKISEDSIEGMSKFFSKAMKWNFTKVVDLNRMKGEKGTEALKMLADALTNEPSWVHISLAQVIEDRE
jgi:hypothetical protein